MILKAITKHWKKLWEPTIESMWTESRYLDKHIWEYKPDGSNLRGIIIEHDDGLKIMKIDCEGKFWWIRKILFEGTASKDTAKAKKFVERYIRNAKTKECKR